MEKGKSIQESWINGVLDEKYAKSELALALLFAQHYFQWFREEEVRSLYNELELIFNQYVIEEGEENHTVNLPIIITQRIAILLEFDLFKCFHEKLRERWYPNILKISHPRGSDYSIHSENLLCSLLILKNASIGNLNAVMEVHMLLNRRDFLKATVLTAANTAAKLSLSNNCRKASKAKGKTRLTKLVYHILKDDPFLGLNLILKRLKNQNDNAKEICHVISVTDGKEGIIHFYPFKHNRETRSQKWRCFRVTVSKARKVIKSKK